MINSVRFSIIENDLNREEEKKCELDDEYDLKSISSESSCEGNPIYHLTREHRRDDKSIWDFNEIESLLKAYPNASLIELAVKESNLDFEFSNHTQMNIGLLFSIWLKNLEFASKILRHGGDPNFADAKKRSALHYACMRGNGSMTRLLLHYKASPNVWEADQAFTPLHCAAISGSADCINLLIRNGAHVNAGIEKKSALHYAVQINALKCVNILLQYGANPNTPSIFYESPLHIAAEMGYLECLKALLLRKASVNCAGGIKRNTPLHLAAEDDFSECVKLLIDFGANVSLKNSDEQTPLHVACLSQSIETVEILIKHHANVNAIYRDGRTALHASIVKETSSWECTRLLLDNGADVNKADNFGYTPLHLAALNEFSSCVLMLIEYGADMTAKTNGGISALSFIVRRSPEVIPKFFAKLDSSVRVNENEIGDVDCEIKLDFRCLVPNIERGETELLMNFIEVGQKRILKHPLCETFLFLKWRRIRKYFLFSLFYHATFVLLFTIYALEIFVNHCPPKCDDKHILNMENSVATTGYFIIVLNFFLLIKEIFQAMHGFVVYLRSWENWLQWIIILGVFLCACPHIKIYKDANAVDHWEYHVAAFVIFLVWLELMMIVGRFPVFGTYVLMFTTVAKNFSKFLMAYSCLLMAFASSFCILFPGFSAFQSVPQSILKTFVMMIGELEFEDMFHAEVDGEIKNQILHPITTELIFFAFIVLVTVILMNLLVGLAVSDIQGLQASAALNRLSRQAELVSRLEGLLFSKLLQKGPPRLLKFLRREALLRTSRYNLQLNLRPNDPREKTIPKEIMTSVYRLVAERRDKNQSIRRKKNIKNMNVFRNYVDEIPVENLRKNNHLSQSILRNRALSDQPQAHESSQTFRNRLLSNEIVMGNVKNQLKAIESKIETLSKKLDNLSLALRKTNEI